MNEILQHLGSLGQLILKILVACIVLRIVMKALDLPIVEYVPIIDDLIKLFFAILFGLAKTLENAASGVVRM